MITLEDINRAEISLGVKWSDERKEKIIGKINYFWRKSTKFKPVEYIINEAKIFN
jgi:hypothetical protein